jgi:hypothetical protein
MGWSLHQDECKDCSSQQSLSCTIEYKRPYMDNKFGAEPLMYNRSMVKASYDRKYIEMVI